MLDKMLRGLGELKEILKENNFDTIVCDDHVTIEITKDGKIEIDTPVRSYRAETLEKAISRALENLQDDIDGNNQYWDDLEDTYQRDRHAAGIGSW